MTMSTPILFLIFNRPQCTRKVFEEIRKNRPKRLYISADGPRCGVSSDAENCRLARQIATEVDWDCTVKTFFREENMGCGRAVQSGISWFFEHEEAGIILEDDCLPDATFFEFCGEMLRKYADDERIMHISGHNPAPNACQNWAASYMYSKFSFVWGWATWRRAWRCYDNSFSNLERCWDTIKNNLVGDETACRYLLDKFQRTRDGELDTWDYAWFYSILTEGGWCVNAASSLVENIGFDQTATHTNRTYFRHPTKATSLKFPLRHPECLSRDEGIEMAFFLTSQKGYWGLQLRRLAPALFFKFLPKTKKERRRANRQPLPIWLAYPRTPAQAWV